MNEKELERIFKALANKRRLAILHFLKKGKEQTVGKISEEIHLSFKSTSNHLGILAHADILEREQRSSQVFYRIAENFPDIVRRIVIIL